MSTRIPSLRGRGSEHPLAAAVLAGARERGLEAPPPARVVAVPGQGIEGVVEERLVLLGTARFLADHGVDAGALAARAEEQQRAGRTIVLLAVNGAPAGLLACADPVRPAAAEAIRTLRHEGCRVVMLTGDTRAVAEAVAREVGIEEVEAEVLPEGKLEVVRSLQGRGRIVAMAGDGINDAPALARADVGVAMGTGTDVAIESAGVTLLKGDLGGLVRARRLSRATLRNVRQNLLWAFLYNALGIPVAAGALYPVLGLVLSPMIASAAMSFSSVTVIVNALRLRDLDL